MEEADGDDGQEAQDITEHLAIDALPSDFSEERKRKDNLSKVAQEPKRRATLEFESRCGNTTER